MKKIVLGILLVGAGLLIKAQSKSYFKVNSDGLFMHVKKLVTTSGFVTAGTHSKDGVKDLQITKWDESFNPVWSFKTTDNNLMSAGNSTINQIVEANDGAFYITSLTTNGQIVIFKLSSTGSLLWQKKYTGSSSLNASSIQKAALGDNGFLFGSGNCSYSNTLVKCDANGAIEWAKTYSHSLRQGVMTVSNIMNDGQNYILGSNMNTSSIVSIRVNVTGNMQSYTAYKHPTLPFLSQQAVKTTNGYVIKCNNNNNDNKRFGICYFDNSLNLTAYTEVINTSNQDIYANSISTNDNGQSVILNGMTHVGIYNLFICKVNANASIAWKHRAQAANSTFNKGVQFNSHTLWGNKIVNVGDGYNEGPFFSIMDVNGDSLCDPLAFNISASNVSLNSLSGSLSTTPVTSITATTTSYTTTNIISYTNTLYCGAIPTGMSESRLSSDAISIYPNPANDRINIAINDGLTESTSVEIYDVFGKLVVVENEITDSRSIDISNLPKGLYLLKIKNDNTEIVKKFIKE